MAAAAFSGPEINSRRNSEGDGSFLAQVQTDGGYICGGCWQIDKSAYKQHLSLVTATPWRMAQTSTYTAADYALRSINDY